MPVVDRGHPEAGFVELEPLAVGVVDLVFVIIAIAGLIVVCAGWVIGWLMQEALGGISVLGFHPFGFVGSLIQQATARIAGLLIKRVTAFGEMIWSIARTVWSFCYVVLGAFQWVTSYITGSHQQLQQGLASAQAKEQADINTLDTIVAAESTHLQNEINGLQATEQADIASLKASEAADLAGLSNQLNARITGLHATEESDVANLANKINVDLANLQNGLTVNLDNSINQVNARITQLHAIEEGDVANAVKTAESFATGLVSGLGVGGIAQTLTSMQRQINNVVTETTECLDPLCDTVTPNAKQLGDLGQLLKDLEGLFAAAALTGLLVAAVEDPKRAADDVVNVAGWMSDAGLGLVDVVGRAAGVQL